MNQRLVWAFVAAWGLGLIAAAAWVWSRPEAREMANPGAAFTAFYEDRLATLAASPPATATLSTAAGPVTVSGPEVAELLGLLTHGESRHRHHSHPGDPVELRFEGDPTRYTLARDSQDPDELWLAVIPGPDTPSTSTAPVVAQLGSPELSAWLAAHGALPRP